LTRDLAKQFFGDRQLDYLFIDGDHHYEGVKRDFEMYAPLVRTGGLIAFHDVAVHPPGSGCTVDQLWRELRSHYPESYEFIENAQQGMYGIGAIRWTGTLPPSSATS
jgi:predicted O-methyltransferase YrrM